MLDEMKNKITITYTDYNHNSYIYYLYHLSVTMCGYFATKWYIKQKKGAFL